MAIFEVEISDKIVDTIADLVNTSFSVGGQILFDGHAIGEDDTFVGKNVQMNDKILMLSGAGGSRKIPVPWRRSKNVQNESYTGASAECSDALIFKAKANVVVYGFMWNKEYNKKDFTLKF